VDCAFSAEGPPEVGSFEHSDEIWFPHKTEI
jgi:hypothetical protein